MSKPSRGAAAASKKKAKKRQESRPIVQAAPAISSRQLVQEEENDHDTPTVGAPVLQFRPRAKGDIQARPASGKTPAPSTAKFAQQIVDYSYVYTDLRIIGVLVSSLLVVLVVLSFVIH